MNILSSFLLIISLVATTTSGRKCAPKDVCSCVWDDTKVEISLWNINYPNDIRFKNNPIFDANGATDYVLDYNPCTVFTSNGDCNDVVACQQSKKDSSIAYNAGVPSLETVTTTSDNVIFQYDGKSVGSDYIRSTQVVLKCDTNAVIPSMGKVTVNKVIGSNHEYYEFELTTACACDSGCKPTNSSGHHLSTGSLLCILFIVFVFVYVLAGFLFFKFYKHNEGTEAIPNYEFWKDFPSKVKDGFVFTKNKITKKGGEYESI